MTLDSVLKAVVVWIGILVQAIANGLFRELVLIPVFDKPLALALSGVLLSTMIIVTAYLTLPWFGRRPLFYYVAIGLIWLCLTLIFEFTFGRLVQEKSWAQLFEAYEFREGNLWPVVLLVTAIAPAVAAKIRKTIRKHVD